VKVGSAHLHQCGITIPPKKRKIRRRRGERHDFVSIFSCCRRWTCFSPKKGASNVAARGSSVPSKKKRKFSVYKELRGDDDDDNDDNDGEKDMEGNWGENGNDKDMEEDVWAEKENLVPAPSGRPSRASKGNWGEDDNDEDMEGAGRRIGTRTWRMMFERRRIILGPTPSGRPSRAAKSAAMQTLKKYEGIIFEDAPTTTLISRESVHLQIRSPSYCYDV
jgi:hypothetical protein